MLDNELYKNIILWIEAGLSADEFLSGIMVAKGNQPTNQGAEIDRGIYITKIGPDRHHGSPERKEEWIQPTIDPIAQGFMRHTEKQQLESDFQITVQWDQKPNDPMQWTAMDLANRVAMILKSSATLAKLKGLGIGILRITTVRNTVVQNEKNRFESEPSFDFTLTHQQVIISTSQAVEKTEFNINRV
jgi:hypothetical protein